MTSTFKESSIGVRRTLCALAYSAVTSTYFHLLASASIQLPQLALGFQNFPYTFDFNETRIWVCIIFCPLPYSSATPTSSYVLPTHLLPLNFQWLQFIFFNYNFNVNFHLLHPPTFPSTPICKLAFRLNPTHIRPLPIIQLANLQITLYLHGNLYISAFAEASIHIRMCTHNFDILPRTWIHLYKNIFAFYYHWNTMENSHPPLPTLLSTPICKLDCHLIPRTCIHFRPTSKAYICLDMYDRRPLDPLPCASLTYAYFQELAPTSVQRS